MVTKQPWNHLGNPAAKLPIVFAEHSCLAGPGDVVHEGDTVQVSRRNGHHHKFNHRFYV